MGLSALTDLIKFKGLTGTLKSWNGAFGWIMMNIRTLTHKSQKVSVRSGKVPLLLSSDRSSALPDDLQ